MMKRVGIIIGLMGIAFGITLAALIGTRLSEEALSVVTGAACGVGALLPMIAVLVGILIRRTDDLNVERHARANTAYPPVVIVAPQPNALPAGQNWAASSHAQPASYNVTGCSAGNVVRQFSIIGADGEEIINDGHNNNRQTNY